MDYMIADDNTLMYRLIKNCLGKLWGTLIPRRVYFAGNGIEVLRTLDDLKKRKALERMVLFLDINMPCMDGIQVLDRVKRDESYKSIYVIMCTSENGSDSVREALSHGADDYILKPFTPRILREKVEKSVRNVAMP